MTDLTKEHFIDKMLNMNPNELIEKDIDVVTEMGKKSSVSFRQPDGYVLKAAQFLWSIACLEKAYPKKLAFIARKKFCE